MKKIINIYLASPRGFCAGVKRAIEIVELALQKYGPPIYVRHEIVHNKRVVQELIKKGAVFVEELEEIPLGSRVIFSAHGVSKKIKKVAKDYKHLTLDATCPLVSKVHKQTEKYFNKDYKIILIGHKGHPEVVGIQGQISQELILIQNEEEANKLQLDKKDKVAYVTQTTLSLDDTKNIIEILKRKNPDIEGPELDDICYATQNRQEAVNELYLCDFQEILKEVKLLDDSFNSVVVVGHEPSISESLKFLTSYCRPDLEYVAKSLYPTGGLSVINFNVTNWNKIDEQTGILDAFITPQYLEEYEKNN